MCTVGFLKSVVVLTAVGVVMSCGGGGSNNSVDQESLVGVYMLNNFSLVTVNQETLTPENFSSFSSTLLLNGDGTFTTTTSLNAETAAASGDWVVLGGNRVETTVDGCIEDLSFSLSSGVLTLTDDDVTCTEGIDSETEQWIRL